MRTSCHSDRLALSTVEAENLDKNGDKEQMIRYPHRIFVFWLAWWLSLALSDGCLTTKLRLEAVPAVTTGLCTERPHTTRITTATRGMVSDRNSPFSDLADGPVGTGQKYNAMGERELKRLCKENGLSPRGSKKDMVKRLGA